MKHRLLANTGIYVSELCLGAMTFGGVGMFEAIGALGQKEADTLVHRSLDAGVNFFDTADTYGDGLGEEILAEVLGHKRNEIIIGTKFGYDIYDPTPRDGHKERSQKFDKEFVKYACEQSLRRLGTIISISTRRTTSN